MNVRFATVEDASAIASVHVDAWRQAYVGVLPQATLDGLSVEARTRMWSQAIAGTGGRVLVAAEAGDILGFAAFGPCRDAGAPATEHELWAIYVAPARWRSGVGRALWAGARQAMVNAAADDITVWVLAENQRARNFYESVGLRAAPGSGQRAITVGGTPVDEVRYVMHVADADRGHTSAVMPPATEIRHLSAADAEAFSALRREVTACQPVEMGISLEEELTRPLDSFRSQLSMPLPNAVFGVFVGGDLAATAAVSRPSSFSAAVHKMTMWGVFTSPRHRRQGLSRQVVGHAIAHAFANGIRRVNLTVYVPNEPALRLYRSLGFVECGREPEAVQIGGRYHHGVQLTLRRADADAASYDYP